MAWARVDDQWFAHRKVVGLSLAARGLWATVLSWSCGQRTDHVTDTMVTFLAAGEEGVEALIAELEQAGLWHRNGHGWVIHDWHEYQERSLSEKRAAAGRKGAEKRWKAPTEMANDGNENLPSKANAMAGTYPVPALPVPTQPEDQQPSPDGDEHDHPGESDADDPDEARIIETFTQFWDIYPDRNGKKIGRGKALKQWRKLSWDQRRRAYTGAQHLAASGQLPKDPERFLRRDTAGEYPFDDWQTPAAPGQGARAGPSQQVSKHTRTERF